MEKFTKNASVSIDDMLGDMDGLFITKDNKGYNDFIQHKITALLKKNGWTFKRAEDAMTRCPYDDVIVMHNNEELRGVVCVHGTYPYTGNRQFLNKLENLAHEPTTDEQDAYVGIQQDEQERNANLRLVHDALLNVSRQLGRYRVKYGSETKPYPNKVMVPPKPIRAGPALKCGALTTQNTACKRSRSHGKSTCSMH
jgi:hypothetical protein